MVYQPENLKIDRKSALGQFWGAFGELGSHHPPGSKNHDFCDVNLSDGAETFRIDRTHEFHMWVQYEGHRSTLDCHTEPKSMKISQNQFRRTCGSHLVSTLPNHKSLKFGSKTPRMTLRSSEIVVLVGRASRYIQGVIRGLQRHLTCQKPQKS